MATYQEALELFQIQTGFLDEQLESKYLELRQQYSTDQYNFLSPEYMLASKKSYEILMAYYTLHSYFRTYIVSRNPKSTFDKEVLEEELLKKICDAVSMSKEIDEEFIASIVETLVCNLGLNDYVRNISFEKYSKSSLAGYTKDYQLKVFLSSIKESIEKSCSLSFSSLEKKYNPYCLITVVLRHEIEHANQKRTLIKNGSDMETRILIAENEKQQKRDRELNRIVIYPSLIYLIALLKRKIGLAHDKRIYHKYWDFITSERLADIQAYNLILDLLAKFPKEEKDSFSRLETFYFEELERTLTGGYDKTFAPILFYLERFKQYGDCLEILKKSDDLDLAERLAYGLKVTPLELEFFEQNKEKIISKVRQM